MTDHPDAPEDRPGGVLDEALEIAHVAALEHHGDYPRWQAALDRLPAVETGWRIESGRLVAGAPVAEPEALAGLLKTWIPWRKGPLSLGGVAIDTEWRSDWKWDRLAGAIDLSGRRVLDVGGGNGYFGWRMLDHGARSVLGCDPSVLFALQHQVIEHFAGPAPHRVLALRLEDLPAELERFDIVFSMGVLYHRRDHRAHLADLAARLVEGGELVIETLIIPGSGHECLFPAGRYARMRNVHALPTQQLLGDWLDEAGFGDLHCLDITATGVAEQRSTEWMPFQSLEDALDPQNPEHTIEGHPAPLRTVIKARR